MIEWRTDSEGALYDPAERFEIGPLAQRQRNAPKAYLHDKRKCDVPRYGDRSMLPCMSFHTDIDEAKVEAEGRLA